MASSVSALFCILTVVGSTDQASSIEDFDSLVDLRFEIRPVRARR